MNDSSGDQTPTPSVSEVSDENEFNESDEDRNSRFTGDNTARKRRPSSFEEIDRLCKEVWPVLAVMGGVDRGLRVGERCLHKPSGRKGTVLGCVKSGITSAKIQWEDPEYSVRY